MVHWTAFAAGAWLAAAPANPAGLRATLEAVTQHTVDGQPFSPKAGAWAVLAWSGTCKGCVPQARNLAALARAFADAPDVECWISDVGAFEGASAAARAKGRKGLPAGLVVVEDADATFVRTLEAAAMGQAGTLPTTVTVPAVYVLDSAGHVHAQLANFHDTRPAEFLEVYRPLIEKARKGQIEDASSGNAVGSTIDATEHDVGISRGNVRLKFQAMSDAQIEKALPDVKKQLEQVFPRATEAQLKPMMEKVRAAMKKGEAIELETY